MVTGHETMKKAKDKLQSPELLVFGEYQNPTPKHIRLDPSYYLIAQVIIPASQPLSP